MTVYVDTSDWPYGRMVMCHMIADTRDELLQMASAIGVQTKWIQEGNGKRHPHFDICKAMRKKAVELGAMEISSRELVKRIRTNI